MRKLIAALALVALWAGGVWAAQDVQQGQKFYQYPRGTVNYGVSRSDTSADAVATDGSGHPLISDVSRDRDNFVITTNAINDTMTVGLTLTSPFNQGVAFTAESTAVLTAYPYHHTALCIRVIPAAGDTTTLIRLAVQVRGHTSSSADTASTFAWYPWMVAGAVAATNVDSLGQTTSGAFTAASQYATCWSGEFEVIASPKRGKGGLSAGTIFGAPDGIMVDLCGPRGEWFWAPYMSVRIRCLTGAAKPKVILNIMQGS